MEKNQETFQRQHQQDLKVSEVAGKGDGSLKKTQKFLPMQRGGWFFYSLRWEHRRKEAKEWEGGQIEFCFGSTKFEMPT